MKRFLNIFLCLLLSTLVFNCKDEEDKSPPVVSNLEYTANPTANAGEQISVNVSVTVTTPETAPIINVVLMYSVSSPNLRAMPSITMTNNGSGNTYSANIPNLTVGDNVSFNVAASNKHGQSGQTPGNITVGEAPVEPVLSNLEINPAVPTARADELISVTVSVSVNTPATAPVTKATLTYTIDGPNSRTTPALTMTNNGSGNIYSATISELKLADEVSYSISVENKHGQSEPLSDSFIVTETDYTKLKLNEVSGVGSDCEKFYELMNIGDVPINLDGVKIYYNANGNANGVWPPNGNQGLTWTGNSTQIIQPGELFGLIGRNGGSCQNPETPNSFTTGLTAQRKLIITLEDPDGNLIDQCRRAEDTNDYEINDKSFSRIPDGTGDFYFTDPTPNAFNGTNTADFLLVPQEPLPPPEPGDYDYTQLVINEVNGFDNEKWFEIYNTGDDEINLAGVTAWYDNASVGYRLSWTGGATDVIPAKGWFATPRGDGNLGTGLSANNVNVKLQLRDPDGTELDTYQKTDDFTPTQTDYPHLRNKAHARIPDGTGDWYYLDNSEGTRNATNGTSTEGLTKFGEEVPIEIIPPPDVDYTPLILNEISGEHKYVEIFNSGTEDIPLTGVRLQRNGGTSSGGSEWLGGPDDIIPAGAYRLFLFNSFTPANKDNTTYPSGGANNNGDAIYGVHTNPDNNTSTLVDKETGLNTYAEFTGWGIGSGISDQQILKIALVDPDGVPIDVFIRGDEPLPNWGDGVTGRVREYSYSRMSDGTWANAVPTPGKANGSKEGDIVNPGYLTSQP